MSNSIENIENTDPIHQKDEGFSLQIKADTDDAPLLDSNVIGVNIIGAVDLDVASDIAPELEHTLDDSSDVLDLIEESDTEETAPTTFSQGRFQDAIYLQMPTIDLTTGEVIGDSMRMQTAGEISIEGALRNLDIQRVTDDLKTDIDSDSDSSIMAQMINASQAGSNPQGVLQDSFDIGAIEARSITGVNNNANNDFGATSTAFASVSGHDYGDGISTPNDIDRPNVRDISNMIFAQTGDSFNQTETSNFLWVWGQFLDHDIDLTREGHNEAYNIDVPAGDVHFDPSGSGTQDISFTRSGFADGTGTDVDNPREQVNDITSFVDASNIYGSTAEVEASLRGEGGKMLVSAGDLLLIGMGDHGPEFKSGDVRVNENVGLTAMHTIFTREHNFQVDQLKAANPDLSDEQLYQGAKAIVEAEIQKITYDEFLTKLLGENALETYSGYNPDIDPQITTEFASAAFRVGHTMLSSDIFRIQDNGDESAFGHLTLQGAFFRPDIIMNEGGIDETLRGLGSSYSQDIDGKVIDDVRNFLFGPPGAGGFDLVSLNIQRGRDHGIPDYNSVREAYGLEALDSFDQLTDDADLVAKLDALYGDIAHLDLWVGGLLEDAFGDGMVGETFHAIISHQFTNLRDGDRFWYEDRLSDDLIDLVKDTSLSDIIMRNSDIDFLQDDLFSAKIRQGGDDGDNMIDGSAAGDLLIGFDGADILNGGAGEDVLYGGNGADIYVFDQIDGTTDIVRDFDVTADKVDISGVLDDFDPLTDALDDFVVSTQTDEGLVIQVDQDGHGTNFVAENIVLLENIHDVNLVDILITNQNIV